MQEGNTGRYKGEFQLLGNELRWSEIYHALLERGYQLRERYHPEWHPSWLKSGADISWLFSPDSKTVYDEHVIDATCMRTGKFVMLKEAFLIDSPELDILKYVSTGELTRNPRNHCVQLLDTFDYPGKPGYGIVVTPRLHDVFRSSTSDKFDTLGDALEFVGQCLEGLDFMHEHNIGHRDIALPNIMMDTRDWLPTNFNNVFVYTEEPLKPRSEVDVKYYFIDFGLSSQYPSFEERKKETQGWGRYRDAPELSKTEPYDAFALDVWCMGRVFIDEILTKYQATAFLEALIQQMTLINPTERPTASEALESFLKIKQAVSDDIRRIKLCKKTGIHWKYRPNRWVGMYKYRGWIRKLETEKKIAGLDGPLEQLVAGS